MTARGIERNHVLLFIVNDVLYYIVKLLLIKVTFFNMCSVNDSECGIDDNTSLITTTKILEESKCRKCEEQETVIVLRGKDAYCKSCFLTSATHKFRATLGKSKIVRPSDTVLVAHSGKAGSTALLHLIRAAMHESVHKRLVFKTTVLYIDEGILEKETLDQRKTTLKRISDQIEQLGFRGFVTTINESLSESEPLIWPMDSPILREEEPIKNTFNCISSRTAKDDLLHKLRNRLLIHAARQLNCNKIFTGDSATDLSIVILSNVSMGRGAHLSLDVGFADTRYSDIMLLRPMRNFTNKEIAYYLRFHDLEVSRSGGTSTKEDPHVSIQKLTEKFVTDLDSEFHGTVSTIFKTGEKLSSMNSEQKLERVCALCNAFLDTQISEKVSAIQATDYSQLVSTSSVIEKEKEIESNAENDCNGDCNCKKTCEGKGEETDLGILRKCLCYGCRLILSSCKDEKVLPSFMLNSARSAISFEKMHGEIADFLL